MSDIEIKDSAESKLNELADKGVDSIDSDARYMAYTSRIMTAVRASSRYVAYTSDIGEAFRPVVHPTLVTAAYGVSWLYLSGDVAYETFKAHRRGPTPLEASTYSEPTRLALTAVQRSLFQSVASMALPAFTIHSLVRQATKAFKGVRNPRLKGYFVYDASWGPTVIGLSAVPALPYLFDKPVEHATESAFAWIDEQIRASQNSRRKTDL